jgi:predicted molibdopterin-dependent oxidoreductase YjgC
VAGLVTTFGSGAMTNSIREIDGAKTIFVIGSNTTNAHPVIAQRMRRTACNGAELIVANPKEIDLVRAADTFIQHRPGSDVALLMGMCRSIIEQDLHDKELSELLTPMQATSRRRCSTPWALHNTPMAPTMLWRPPTWQC